MKITYIDPDTKMQYWLGMNELLFLSTEEIEYADPQDSVKIQYFVLKLLGEENIKFDGESLSWKDSRFRGCHGGIYGGGVDDMLPKGEDARKNLILGWIYNHKAKAIRQDIYDLLSTIKTPTEVVQYEGYIPISLIADFAKSNISIHQVELPNNVFKSFIHFSK